jgi:probable catabolite control protein A
MYKYNIILANSCDDKEIEKNIFASFVSKQVDGIIYLGHSLSESSKNYLKDIKIPVVLAGNLGTDSEFYAVNIDYEKAAYDVTKEFLEKGSKNISLVIDRYESQKTQRIIKGYKEALASKKVEFKPQQIIDGYRTYKESNRIFRTITNTEADVVITMFDEVALAVMHQALDAGMNIPGEIEIISLENTKLLDMTRPKISSIFQPIFDIGAVSMRILTKIIDIEKAKRKGEEIDEEELEELKIKKNEMNLPYRIIHRQTTK